MIIKPKTRGFICTTAHPVGCAAHVQEQIQYVSEKAPIAGPKNVLILGASTGYGLSTRIAAAFGSGAKTIGVFFEKPPTENHTASAGWYNTAAFEKAAQDAGLYAKSINGDAFSDEIKKETLALIQKDLGKIDLVVYSLASPRRTHPKTGETYNSVIKPIGSPYTNKTVDFHSGVVSDVTIEPATEEEITQTVSVMGGEDWEMWMTALREADLLADGVQTVAFSYIGPGITHAIYKDGTIGQAKIDLENAAKRITAALTGLNGQARISVNKALVTQASSAIPVVPLYISILYKVMKEKGIHEGCIEQMYRLLAERLYTKSCPLDEAGRIRLDDLEMLSDVQEEVFSFWENVQTESLDATSDIAGYREAFYQLFGFGIGNVDETEEVDPMVWIPSINYESMKT